MLKFHSLAYSLKGMTFRLGLDQTLVRFLCFLAGNDDCTNTHRLASKLAIVLVHKKGTEEHDPMEIE